MDHTASRFPDSAGGGVYLGLLLVFNLTVGGGGVGGGVGFPSFLQCNYSSLISTTLLSVLLGQEPHEGTFLFHILQHFAITSRFAPSSCV